MKYIANLEIVNKEIIIDYDKEDGKFGAKLKKLLDELEKNRKMKVFLFQKETEEEIRAYVVNELNINARDVVVLLEMIGRNPFKVRNEVKKIKVFLGEEKFDIEKIKNIAMIKNINEYLNFKVRIEELMFLTLETCINFEEYINVNVDNFEIVKKARKILDRKNITQPIRIGELCKIMNKTRYQLQISFEKVEGIGIFEYIQKRRMEYSKNLLITTNKSILEIASEVGYENPSKFSEVFKNYFGILPNKYRKIF